jgi:CheY-like chemotaxis protein
MLSASGFTQLGPRPSGMANWHVGTILAPTSRVNNSPAVYVARDCWGVPVDGEGIRSEAIQMQTLTALVAARDSDWRNIYQDALEQQGCVVFPTPDGLEGMQLMKEHQYDIVVVDESLAEAGQVEFVLSVRDLMTNGPVILVAGASMARFVKVWQQCNVYSADSRSATVRRIADAVNEALSRTNGVGDNSC